VRQVLWPKYLTVTYFLAILFLVISNYRELPIAAERLRKRTDLNAGLRLSYAGRSEPYFKFIESLARARSRIIAKG